MLNNNEILMCIQESFLSMHALKQLFQLGKTE